jgi:hypothetical protein
MTTTAARAAIAAMPGEEGAPLLAPSLVEAVLQHLGKAIRARQLYLPNNPVYQRTIEQLRQRFAGVWAETDELTVLVLESEFRWEGVSLLHEASRSDSLAWLFYKDGIRALTFLPGIEGDELSRLLDLLQRVRRAQPEDDDLLTLLWEEDFLNLRYRYVDLAADSLPAIEPGESAAEPRQVDPRAVAAEAQRPAPSIVRMQDFDSALYYLEDAEIEYLRGAFQAESTADLRRNVTAILFDIYEQERADDVRSEIAGVLDQLVLHFLATGDYHAVAHVVREGRTTAERARAQDAAQAERLDAVLRRLGSPEVLAQLIQTLDDARDVPAAEELDALFEVLGAAALATVLGWLARLQAGPLRAGLERAATRLASNNVTELVRLIGSPESAIALQAARRAGELRTTAAVGALARLLAGTDAPLRVAAAQALAEIGSPGALQQLERAVEDADRDVRVTAVRVLGARGHRAALPRLEEAVRGRELRDADLTEKMAYFEAYGLLAGAPGVAHLDAMLNGRSFLGRREDPELRACAALALGKIGTGEALDALRRAAGDRDLVVRNAVAKAMRGSAA